MTVMLWPILAFTGLAVAVTLWLAIGDLLDRQERRNGNRRP